MLITLRHYSVALQSPLLRTTPATSAYSREYCMPLFLPSSIVVLTRIDLSQMLPYQEIPTSSGLWYSLRLPPVDRGVMPQPEKTVSALATET